MEPVDLEDYLQLNFYAPSARPANRQKYWDYFNAKGFDALAKRYGKGGPFVRIRDMKLLLKAGRR